MSSGEVNAKLTTKIYVLEFYAAVYSCWLSKVTVYDHTFYRTVYILFTCKTVTIHKCLFQFTTKVKWVTDSQKLITDPLMQGIMSDIHIGNVKQTD